MDYSQDYYAVLGVLPSIEQTALTAVFKALAKKYHPDVYSGDKVESEEIIKKLNAAYEVLGDKDKRDEYDKRRRENNEESGDYNQASQNERADQNKRNEKLENWDYATKFYPDAEKHRKLLDLFSPRLSLTYQIILMEEKSFPTCVDLGERLKKEFLLRYFGNNSAVHELVEIALIKERRDIALEVNKAIKIMGSPSKKEEEHFINVIRNKFGFGSGKNWRGKIVTPRM